MNTPPPWENFLPIQSVIELHSQGIDIHGGIHSAPKDGCVEQSLGNAYNAEQYNQTDDSEGGLCFAGFVLFYLASNHCFTDGNKRIGWAACMRVLLNLGLTIDATDDDAEVFCMRIADSTRSDSVKDGMEVVNWIAERLVAI